MKLKIKEYFVLNMNPAFSKCLKCYTYAHKNRINQVFIWSALKWTGINRYLIGRSECRFKDRMCTYITHEQVLLLTVFSSITRNAKTACMKKRDMKFYLAVTVNLWKKIFSHSSLSLIVLLFLGFLFDLIIRVFHLELLCTSCLQSYTFQHSYYRCFNISRFNIPQ